MRLKKIFDSINPIRFLAISFIDRLNYQEYLKPPFGRFNERPVEYRFLFEQISAIYPKTVLDVGTGITALPHLIANCGCQVTSIDNIKDYWNSTIFNRHYYVINDDIRKPKIKTSFDMITCISTLEHIDLYNDAVKSMSRLLKSGGHLILSFPYNELQEIDNVYELPNSYIKHLPKYKTRSFSRNNLNKWAQENNLSIVRQEYWQFFSGDYWTTGERLTIPKQTSPNDKHQISCILFQKK